MEAMITARETLENLSDGIDSLYAIDQVDVAEATPALSKMRDALYLMKKGARFYSPASAFVIDDEMIVRLDALIERLGGLDGSTSATLRDDARRYLADLLGRDVAALADQK